MSLLDNLVSYWKLDESSDGSGAVTRYDSHGSNHLTDNNTTASGTGKINSGAAFVNATSEYLNIADNASLSFGDESFSVSLWVKANSLLDNAGPLGKWDLGKEEFGINYRTTGTPGFRFFAKNAASVTGNAICTTLGAASTGVWYHIVGVYDADTDTVKIRINDTYENTVSHSGGCNDNSSSFSIGRYYSVGSTFDGTVDEVGIWRRVLTATEITQLYNSGSGLAYPFSAPRLVGNSPLLQSARLHSTLLGA